MQQGGSSRVTRAGRPTMCIVTEKSGSGRRRGIGGILDNDDDGGHSALDIVALSGMHAPRRARSRGQRRGIDCRRRRRNFHYLFTMISLPPIAVSLGAKLRWSCCVRSGAHTCACVRACQGETPACHELLSWTEEGRSILGKTRSLFASVVVQAFLGPDRDGDGPPVADWTTVVSGLPAPLAWPLAGMKCDMISKC